MNTNKILITVIVILAIVAIVAGLLSANVSMPLTAVISAKFSIFTNTLFSGFGACLSFIGGVYGLLVGAIHATNLMAAVAAGTATLEAGWTTAGVYAFLMAYLGGVIAILYPVIASLIVAILTPVVSTTSVVLSYIGWISFVSAVITLFVWACSPK